VEENNENLYTITHTLQGTSRTSSTNPRTAMKPMHAKAALYSTSHCKITIADFLNAPSFYWCHSQDISTTDHGFEL
jgi:hypothetical protein